MTRPTLTARGHVHGEAFCLMTYVCDRCGRREQLWNSRDGVTPFCIPCPVCKPRSLKQGAGQMQHVEWARDEYRPDYQPRAGERIFRDGTVAEARTVMRERLAKCRGTAYELPEAEWEAVIESAANSGEFQPGWPMIETTTRASAPEPPDHV